MTASGRRIDQLARLEEERSFLLHSLDDLDVEIRNGDLDEHEYLTIRNDYIARVAAVSKRIAKGVESLDAVAAPQKSKLMYLGLIIIMGVMAGIFVAQYSGLRQPGDTITGEIEQSPRALLAEAENFFLQGEFDRSRLVVEEILRDTPDSSAALLLSARLHEEAQEILEAIRQLDQILENDVNNLDALTLRGWILVRIDSPELLEEGIRNLDRAIRNKPKKFDAYVFRGYVARYVEKDLERAVLMYETALSLDPPPAMADQLRLFVTEMNDEVGMRG